MFSERHLGRNQRLHSGNQEVQEAHAHRLRHQLPQRHRHQAAPGGAHRTARHGGTRQRLFGPHHPRFQGRRLLLHFTVGYGSFCDTFLFLDNFLIVR